MSNQRGLTRIQLLVDLAHWQLNLPSPTPTTHPERRKMWKAPTSLQQTQGPNQRFFQKPFSTRPLTELTQRNTKKLGYGVLWLWLTLSLFPDRTIGQAPYALGSLTAPAGSFDVAPNLTSAHPQTPGIAPNCHVNLRSNGCSVVKSKTQEHLSTSSTSTPCNPSAKQSRACTFHVFSKLACTCIPNSGEKTAHVSQIHIWLVVWIHVKNISQLGWLFPIYGKI